MESGQSETSRLDEGHLDGWLYSAIDLFASEYGWTINYILNYVYPDDFILLGELISKRIIDKVLMDFQIAHNPHREPEKAQEFADELMEQRRKIYGFDVNHAQLDRAALDKLKDMIKSGGSLLVSK